MLIFAIVLMKDLLVLIKCSLVFKNTEGLSVGYVVSEE